jgi:hypothetical protein
MSSADPIYPDAKHPNEYQRGVEWQDFVCQYLVREGIVLQNFSSKKYQYEVGENLQGWEIKRDDRCTDTGRLSIEVAEKSSRGLPFWTDSGIMSRLNPWLYIQGNRSILFIFATKTLRAYLAKYNCEVTEKMGTIKTFYIPMDVAEYLALKVIRLDQDAP